MIDVHQNAALSESFEGDRSRVIGNRCKNWFMFSVRISSYGCTREVWRTREKRTPRATLAS